MISPLLEFFQSKKQNFVKTRIEKGNYKPSWVNSETGTLWLSEYDEVEIEEIDWGAFEKAVLEFEESFKEGGNNAHRNPLNKEPK